MSDIIQCKNSSLLHSFQYDQSERILRVFFLSGYIYDYFFVPEEVAEELRRLAESGESGLGKWFSKNIKNVFVFQRLKQKEEEGNG